MSDTPETDAQLRTFDSLTKYGKRFTNRTGQVNAEFARKLERERDQWRDKCKQQAERIRVLEGATNHAGGTPLKQWRECAEKLAELMDGGDLNDRIDAHNEFERLKEANK